MNTFDERRLLVCKEIHREGECGQRRNRKKSSTAVTRGAVSSQLRFAGRDRKRQIREINIAPSRWFLCRTSDAAAETRARDFGQRAPPCGAGLGRPSGA